MNTGHSESTFLGYAEFISDSTHPHLFLAFNSIMKICLIIFNNVDSSSSGAIVVVIVVVIIIVIIIIVIIIIYIIQ